MLTSPKKHIDTTLNVLASESPSDMHTFFYVYHIIIIGPLVDLSAKGVGHNAWMSQLHNTQFYACVQMADAQLISWKVSYGLYIFLAVRTPLKRCSMPCKEMIRDTPNMNTYRIFQNIDYKMQIKSKCPNEGNWDKMESLWQNNVLLKEWDRRLCPKSLHKSPT